MGAQQILFRPFLLRDIADGSHQADDTPAWIEQRNQRDTKPAVNPAQVQLVFVFQGSPQPDAVPATLLHYGGLLRGPALRRRTAAQQRCGISRNLFQATVDADIPKYAA